MAMLRSYFLLGTKEILKKFGKPFKMPGIEPRLAVCMASVLPALQSPQFPKDTKN